jgi:hypothetical protein
MTNQTDEKLKMEKTAKLIDFPNELLIKSLPCQSSKNLWFRSPTHLQIAARERGRGGGRRATVVLYSTKREI